MPGGGVAYSKDGVIFIIPCPPTLQLGTWAIIMMMQFKIQIIQYCDISPEMNEHQTLPGD